MALMSSYVTFGLAIFLLACQVIVVVALVVLVKQYRSLKKAFEDHKASINLQSLRRSTEVKETSKNKYIEGKRSSGTLVRTNSDESIVWVPTAPKRREAEQSSNELNMTNTTIVVLTNQDEHNTTTDTHGNEAAVRIEQENGGFEEDDAIYSNQDIVDMAAEQNLHIDSTTRFPQDTTITFEYHATNADHVTEDDGCVTEPIYENLRGRIDPRLLQA